MKDPLLKKYYGLVNQLWGSFEKIQLIQIPKEKNTKADKLSKLNPFDPKTTSRILVEYMDQPSTMEEVEVMVIDLPN